MHSIASQPLSNPTPRGARVAAMPMRFDLTDLRLRVRVAEANSATGDKVLVGLIGQRLRRAAGRYAG